MTMDVDWSEMASQTLPGISGRFTWGSSSAPTTTAFSASQANMQPSMEIPTATNANSTNTDTKSYNLSSGAIFMTLRDRNNFQQTNFMEQLMERTRQNTRIKTQKIIDERIQESWNKKRKEYIQSIVGNRSVRGHPSQSVGENQFTSESTAKITDYSTYDNQIRAIVPHHDVPMDYEQTRAHLNIVQASQDVTQNLLDYLTHLPTTPSNTAYKNAINMVSHFKQERPTDIALGTLTHYAKQMKETCQEAVDQASRQALDTSIVPSHLSVTAAISFKYVQLARVSSNVTSDNHWAAIYFCLRCGDANAATQLWKQDEASPARRLLHKWAERQGASNTVWESGIPRVLPEDVQAVRNLGDVADPYERGVLALLSGSPLSFQETVPGIMSTEDFLYSKISSALFLEDKVNALVEVSDEIVESGPDYFGNGDAGSWIYVLALLATQRFRTALMHLSQTAVGLQRAVHLALILGSAGIAVQDLGNVSQKYEDNLAKDLLTSYADYLLHNSQFGAACALEYTARIPNRVAAMKETAKLISKIGDIPALAGNFHPNSGRQDGQMLDRHFQSKEVASILSDAADILARDKSREAMARSVLCNLLAGRFDMVIAQLNHLISPPDAVSEEHSFWVHQAKMFREIHLTASAVVGEALQQSGQRHVITTNRILLDMVDVSTCLREHKYSDAMSIIDRTRLLPETQDEVASKHADFASLDLLVHKAMPSFVRGAMQTILELNRASKTGAGLTRVDQLKSRADALEVFATALQLDRKELDTMSKAAREMQ